MMWVPGFIIYGRDMVNAFGTVAHDQIPSAMATTGIDPALVFGMNITQRRPVLL